MTWIKLTKWPFILRSLKIRYITQSMENAGKYHSFKKMNIFVKRIRKLILLDYNKDHSLMYYETFFMVYVLSRCYFCLPKTHDMTWYKSYENVILINFFLCNGFCCGKIKKYPSCCQIILWAYTIKELWFYQGLTYNKSYVIWLKNNCERTYSIVWCQRKHQMFLFNKLKIFERMR